MTASKFNEVSRASKMYREFCDELIRDNLEYSKICNYIYPRWCLGVLFSATKIMTWQDFKKLYCQLEGRKLFFELIKLKDKKDVYKRQIIMIVKNIEEEKLKKL